MTSSPGPLVMELVARLRVMIAEPLDVGAVPGGHRRVIPISGGSVDGPLIRGEVIGLGADWNLQSVDGHEEASARYLLRTDDGFVLSVRNEGRLTVRDGKVVGITRPEIEAPEGRYGWLNGAVLTGTLSVIVESEQVIGVALDFWRAGFES